jgi:hypothetical protein
MLHHIYNVISFPYISDSLFFRERQLKKKNVIIIMQTNKTETCNYNWRAITVCRVARFHVSD